MSIQPFAANPATRQSTLESNQQDPIIHTAAEIAELRRLLQMSIAENQSLRSELVFLKQRVDNLDAQAVHHGNLHTAYAATVPALNNQVTLLTAAVKQVQREPKWYIGNNDK